MFPCFHPIDVVRCYEGQRLKGVLRTKKLGQSTVGTERVVFVNAPLHAEEFSGCQNSRRSPLTVYSTLLTYLYTLVDHEIIGIPFACRLGDGSACSRGGISGAADSCDLSWCHANPNSYPKCKNKYLEVMGN